MNRPARTSAAVSAAAGGPAGMPGGSGGPGRIYLVTGADQPDLGADDRLLYAALRAAGVPVTVAVWTDSGVDWSGAAACLIRSVWDYHLHPDRFAGWLDRASAVTTVLNPPRLVAWNMHKRYLVELAAAGVPTVDTVWITPGGTADLDRVLRERGWTRALLKPAVSASAWRTAAFGPGDAGAQPLLAEILRHCDAMVQPYLTGVERDGEVSIIAIGGEITHAARRPSALTGDIELTRHGGPHEITADERALAQRVLGLLPETPLYARVDLLRDERNRPLLGELELIEPVLYLRHGPRALDRLVALLRRYAGKPTAAVPAGREPVTAFPVPELTASTGAVS